jgi:hypothetical protein
MDEQWTKDLGGQLARTGLRQAVSLCQLASVGEYDQGRMLRHTLCRLELPRAETNDPADGRLLSRATRRDPEVREDRLPRAIRCWLTSSSAIGTRASPSRSRRQNLSSVEELEDCAPTRGCTRQPGTAALADVISTSGPPQILWPPRSFCDRIFSVLSQTGAGASRWLRHG